MLALGGCTSPSIDDVPPSPGYTLVGTTTDINVCNTGGAAALLRCTAPTTTPAALRLALGVCGDLVVDNALTLDQAGSNVQVSGVSTISAPLSVDGDFLATGSVRAANTETIAGSFSTAGDWTVSAPATVGGDANVGGTLDATSPVMVAGLETVPADAVSIDLDCAAAPDVASLVTTASAAMQHDASADAELPGNSLVNVDAPTELTLGCGQYTLDSIGVNAALTLHVEGTTSLVVTGNVTVAAPLLIELRDDATLDLAIGGALSVANTATIGDGAHPSALWVGVAGPVMVGAPLTMAGSLVSNGLVTANNTVDLTGSALVNGLEVASPMNVHLTAAAPALSAAGCAIPGAIAVKMARSGGNRPGEPR